jgi:hypothetical protein
MEREELKTIKDLLEAHSNDIKESRIVANELIVKTIQEEIQKKVNGKIDDLHNKIDIMELENKSRGTAIYDIGEKLQKFILRLEPVAKAFETNKLFSSILISKVKFLAMIAGLILAIFAGWELIIKALIKPFIEK